MRTFFSLFSQQIMKRIVNRVIRQLMMASIAGILLILGVIFMSMGFVEGLSLIVARWAAYIIVGLVLTLIGLALMVAYLANR
jgi:hypothetical protein